jgi:hypothetical protein
MPRSLNVATPEDATAVLVPTKAPPVLIVAVTVSDEVDTMLLSSSVIVICGWVVNTTPAAVPTDARNRVNFVAAPAIELSTVNLNTSFTATGDADRSKDMVKPELLTSVKVTPVVAGIEKNGDPDETITAIELTELTKLSGVEDVLPNPLKERVLSWHPLELLSTWLTTSDFSTYEPAPAELANSA